MDLGESWTVNNLIISAQYNKVDKHYTYSIVFNHFRFAMALNLQRPIRLT